MNTKGYSSLLQFHDDGQCRDLRTRAVVSVVTPKGDQLPYNFHEIIPPTGALQKATVDWRAKDTHKATINSADKVFVAVKSAPQHLHRNPTACMRILPVRVQSTAKPLCPALAPITPNISRGGGMIKEIFKRSPDEPVSLSVLANGHQRKWKVYRNNTPK